MNKVKNKKEKSNSSPNVITLRLKTELFQEHILEKRINICRMIYNSMVNVVKKQLNKLFCDPEYKENMLVLKETLEKLKKIKEKIKEYEEIIKKDSNNKDIKSELKKLKLEEKEIKNKYENISKILGKIRQKYLITKFDMYKLIKPMYKVYNSHIQSCIAQDISFRVWQAVEKFLFKDGKKIHYKKYNEYNSFASTQNSQIIYKDGYIFFNGLKLKVHFNKKNGKEYEREFLETVNIKLIKIKRKFIKNKYRYYADIVYTGKPISLYRKENIKLIPGKIGIDIGTQTIAVVSNADVKLCELADKITNIEKEKRRILRYLDRSRRANNPENYNDDGTIKKGRKKLKWKKSKKYIKTQNKLKDLYRKQADIRTLQHWELANEIVKLGDTVIVEKMNFKALQKRAKETKKKENGRFKSKKRFGKSLGEKAPAKFLNILKYKITSLGGNYYECETKDIKASQYNHITDDYEKKKLSNRWNNFGEYKVQRDLYSAFLIQHVNEDLKTIDREGCINDFNNFKMLHDKEIERLKKSTLSKALRNVL